MVDFQKEVLDQSFELPVLVDFWAPWCGPCKILGPVIEQLASEQATLWALVKLNTEDQPEIADQFSIRSIPNVKLFYRGEVINEFTGALSRQMILDWLKKALPNPGLIALDHLLSIQDVPEISSVEELMEQFPGSAEIRIVLAQLLLWDDPVRVVEILDPIKMGTAMYDKASFLRDISAFLQVDTTDPQLSKIQLLLKEGSLEDVISLIIEELSKNNKAAESKLAKAAIGMFNTLGAQHPLTKTYRKQLDMYL